MKFIYLADTHIGGDDNIGYCKQPRYLRFFQEIIEGLARKIKEIKDIDFIIHGGDMIDAATPESIIEAGNFFSQLPCPTYLVLGNHDLTVPNSLEMWLEHATQFFPDNKFDFRLIKDGVQIDAVLCNWCEIPAYWNLEKPLVPWLFPEQMKQIAHIEMACHTQIVVMHSPIYGMPPEQHGGTESLDAPSGDLCEKLAPVLKNASLVLGAHNHMNMTLLKDERHYVTTASLSEMPFEFKIIEVTHEKLSMKTIGLSNLVSFCGKYDFESAYIQGRSCDRNIERSLSCG
ncbi:MAG: metallophosphoesterase [Victivallaceae bacterium]|nr:metallophosphoesterase [Victivallaceae bacterium]